MCVAHEVDNVTDEVWAEHRQKKDQARDEKNREKEHAIQYWSANQGMGVRRLLLHAWTVLLSPGLQASALYYKQNLCVHNFTVYNLATHEAMCYVWHEGEGGLSSSEFTSCIIDYLEENPEYDVFTLFSDGCGYQNRNVFLSNALLEFTKQRNITVIQKILERGQYTDGGRQCAWQDRIKTKTQEEADLLPCRLY